MEELMFPGSSALGLEDTIRELRDCGPMAARFGLGLTPAEQRELALVHRAALWEAGRIELEGGDLKRLIFAFCDSPYLLPETYAGTLAELQTLFYHFLNELGDQLSDDELLTAMAARFNGLAAGSLDALADTPPEVLLRLARGEETDEG